MDRILNIGEDSTLDKVVMLGQVPSDIGCLSGILCSSPAQHIVLERGARLNLVYIMLPGTSSDLSLSLDLAGDGAEAFISGIYLCDGEDRISVAMDVRHKVPHCTSRQLFKGLVSGASRAQFYGKITVEQDAQKTEAYQENHSILLSDTARVDTKPQLEIYADDVKCSHGATIGRLNEEEQFYMRSRGIPEQEAKVLQMFSFLSPVLSFVSDEETREKVTDIVDKVVRTL